MHDLASEEYLSFQQTAVHLAGEQVALRQTSKELHAEFVAAVAARDILLAEWRDALHVYDCAPSAETACQCQGLARAVCGTDSRLVALTTMRRDIAQQRRVLRHAASRATIHALRARRALDESLFEVAPTSTDGAHGGKQAGKAEVRAFFHDMREHLTVAVLAAGKLGTSALPPRVARFHTLLIRGLTGLTEDLEVLDPVPAVDLRPTLTLLPRPVPPPESTPIPGT